MKIPNRIVAIEYAERAHPSHVARENAIAARLAAEVGWDGTGPIKILLLEPNHKLKAEKLTSCC